MFSIHPIAKDGYIFSALFLSIFILTNNYFSNPLSYIFLGVSIFCLFFFRDPKRIVIADKNSIIAAADGKIMEIDEFYEPIFLKEDCVRIATFLSLFNVHINRAPIEGKVAFQKREKGKNYPAFLKGSKKNGRNYIGITNEQVSVLTIQMVGIIANRIVSWVKEEQELFMGQKIGLIRFGSRTDIIIPKSKISEITVRHGDKVKAGETIIATLK